MAEFDINSFLSSPAAALGIGLLTSRTPQEGISQGVGLLSANAARKRQEMLDQLQTLKLQKEINGGDNPANVKEWEYYNKLTPDQQKAYLGMKRALPSYDIGGARIIGDPTTGAPALTIPKTLPPQDDPVVQGQQAGAKKSAELDATKQSNRGKAEAALTGLQQQSKLVTDTIDQALGTVSPWSTGYGHVLFSSAPNTDARKLDNYLNTIKANVGFDKLQQMRESSPTGGALGQVSDMENKLLQAVNGALDPLQKDQLVENLNSIKKLYPQVLAERQKAFERDYGTGSPQNSDAPIPDKPTDNYNAADVFTPNDGLPASLPPAPAPQQPKRLKFNPATGRLE